MTLWHGASVFAAAFVAGMINSVAGGGTLLTFPTLVWVGLSPVTANATSTVAIWPGALGSMWGYRENIRHSERRLLLLVIPSLTGGMLGAWLLRYTPPAIFAALVPYLILFATILFMVQESIQRWLGLHQAGETHKTARWLTGAMVFQFFVALYGGYFGAGIGILMLAALSIIGLHDIHQMNGLKNFFGMCINGVAALYFVVMRMVYWPDVAVMAVAAIVGGYGGAGLARRLGRTFVRRAVVAIGFAMAISLLVKH